MERLRLIFWETTAACNLACRHCRRLEVNQALSQQDLTTQEGERLIDGIVELGRPVLVFSGGEPLLRPDLFQLASYAKARDLGIALATNGTLVDEPTAERIAGMGFDRVAISLDGTDAQTHDAFRQQPGAFDQALAGFHRLKHRQVSLQVNTTITQHNVGELEQLYELVKTLCAEAWHLFMFVPVGCGLSVPEDEQLVAEQYEAVLTWIAERSSTSSLFIRATCAPQYFRILAQRHELARYRAGTRLQAMTKGCLAGTGIGFISHKGEIFPCGYLPMACGNVRQMTLGEIWRGAPVLERLRTSDFLKGKCGVCEFRQVCSGCRARAFAMTGDYLAEEPCCPYQPQTCAAGR